ncbi:MAG: gliding motility-associated C-terminal domain-containing protein [Saprospiraceae bacterium]|nr:gliding motility-associated C-terminal domain-containing protein [Saprospiraceae bacterium]
MRLPLYTLYIWLLLNAFQLSGQEFKFSFENCDLQSPLGNGILNGNPGCECGLIDQSIFLDGNDDGFILPDTTVSFMKNDFTIDFYMSSDNTGNQLADIMAIGNACGLDSLITLKHLVSTDEIILELYNINGNYYALKEKMPADCWNRITIVKSKLNYLLYLNNIEVAKVITAQNIPFAKNAKLTFANSPCLTTTDERFKGRIDELTIYSRALSDREIFQNYLYPDKLISNDTTIYLGNSANLIYGNSCASNFSWQPSMGLNSVSDASVVATPDVTTTYMVSSVDKGCASVNKVTVYVVDEDSLECTNLLLPGAFTPNGDGVNDVYNISNNFIIDELNGFEVMDRWGSVLFRSVDKLEGWDGSYLGNACEPAMYVYRVNYSCKGQSHQKMGNFVLLK